jgi:hypothetical protein
MRRLAAPLLCLLAVSACAHHPYGYGSPDYGDDYGYQGNEWSGHDMDELFQLDPWLEDTREGRSSSAAAWARPTMPRRSATSTSASATSPTPIVTCG